VPVGTLAIGRAGAINAALLAAAVIALGDDEVAAALDGWRARQTDRVAHEPPPVQPRSNPGPTPVQPRDEDGSR
jgi:5-(carboxyamino)imidazole ribonucleotide mutase